jgi:cell division protein FtsQ
MKLLPNFKFPQLKFKSSAIAVFWAIIILSLMAFVNKRQSQKQCQKIRISIDNEFENHFIEEEDVNNLMTNNEKENLVGESHQYISLKEMEKRIHSHGFVEKVWVSKDLKGNIDVKVTQYQPIARISLPNGNDKYISSGGKILPVSNRFTARVPVIAGPFNNKLVQKDWKKDSLRTPYFEFVNRVLADDFLRIMVSAAYINQRGEINIYPQIGKQTIEYGLPINQDVKFAMMHSFYDKIIPAKGWNKYSRVCIKYHNQIICE